ncbi:hypothetical protein [Tanticharoenia sakaeratensis]|uniref:hypothetical protein n=1 Tax=Tanticharoenia sakaeratensis TaxID=444053 RepID=UPI0011DD4FB6|nr:hypothetical protein [Tanticharoenia sakaeratensis]
MTNGYPIVRQWGDLKRIATACGGLSVQTVSEWKRVPRRRVAAVAAALGVPPGVLRPDLHLSLIAEGEPSTLLELLLAWRMVCAARRTLQEVEKPFRVARDHEAEAKRALKKARRRYYRDKAKWEPRWLEMQQEEIATLRGRVQDVLYFRNAARKAFSDRRRWLVQTGIPLSFLNNVSSNQTL